MSYSEFVFSILLIFVVAFLASCASTRPKFVEEPSDSENAIVYFYRYWDITDYREGPLGKAEIYVNGKKVIENLNGEYNYYYPMRLNAGTVLLTAGSNERRVDLRPGERYFVKIALINGRGGDLIPGSPVIKEIQLGSDGVPSEMSSTYMIPQEKLATTK